MFVKSRSVRHWRRYHEIVGTFFGLAFMASNPSPTFWGQRMIIGGLILIISLGVWLLILLFHPRNK